MTTNSHVPQKKLVLISSRLRRPAKASLSRAAILARLLSDMAPLDAEQLQVLHLAALAISRGAR